MTKELAGAFLAIIESTMDSTELEQLEQLTRQATLSKDECGRKKANFDLAGRIFEALTTLKKD
jgi:hypothetical protein